MSDRVPRTKAGREFDRDITIALTGIFETIAPGSAGKLVGRLREVAEAFSERIADVEDEAEASLAGMLGPEP